MTKAAVVYDSKFGNNMRLAKALAKGLTYEGVSVDCLKVSEFDEASLTDYDLIVVGGPTNMARMSKRMQGFFHRLKTVKLRGKKGFCFGTRIESRMNILDINGSAKKIEGKLRGRGVSIVKPAVNVIVEGREGPTVPGSTELFNRIGSELARLIEG